MKTIAEMMKASDVPVVIADRQGNITHVNAPFCAVFGWEREELLGQPLTRIIPPDLRDAHHMGFSRFLTTGSPTLLERPLTLKAVTKTGRVFEAEHYIIAERRDGDWAFGATIRPLTGA